MGKKIAAKKLDGYVDKARSFHERRNGSHIFEHNKTVFERAKQTNILTPRTAEKEGKHDAHNCVLALEILHHAFANSKFLPGNLEHRAWVRDDFEVFCELTELDLDPDRDVRKYAELFSRRIHGVPPLALLAKFADLMTVHDDPLISNMSDNPIFRRYSDWPLKRKAIADAALKVYGPFADRLGYHAVQRAINELAVAELYPEKLDFVRKRKEELAERIERTKTLLLENVLSAFMKTLGCQDFSKELPATVNGYRIIPRVEKSDGSSVLKLEKPKYADLTDFHDLAASIILTPNKDRIYDVMAALTGNGGIISRILRMHGLVFQGDFDIKITDYVARPKENGYRSLHIDVEILNPDWVSFEIIIRTFDMHKEAERGGSAHYLYKGGTKQESVLSDYDRLVESLSIGCKFVEKRAIDVATHAPEMKVRVQAISADGKVHGEFVSVPHSSTVLDAIARLKGVDIDLSEGFGLGGNYRRLSSPLRHHKELTIKADSGSQKLDPHAAKGLIPAVRTLEAAKMLRDLAKEGNGNTNGKKKKRKRR